MMEYLDKIGLSEDNEPGGDDGTGGNAEERKTDENQEKTETEESKSDTIKETISYEDFLKKLQDDLCGKLGYKKDDIQFYPEGFTSEDPLEKEAIVDANRRYKDNKDAPALLLDMLVLKETLAEGVSYFQQIDCRFLYDVYRKSGYDKVLEVLKEHRKNTREAAGNGDRIKARIEGSYNAVREQLIIRPLNYSRHCAELSSHIYRRVGDVALVLYQVIGNTDNDLITSKIHRAELELWGMKGQEEKAFSDALENTARLYPPCVFDKKKRKPVNFLTDTFAVEDILWMGRYIVLSTFQATNGAVAIFYPGVVEKMMELLGGPFWAVFMNTTDVMILKKGSSFLDSALATAKEGTAVGEPLSGRCYECDETGVHVRKN